MSDRHVTGTEVVLWALHNREHRLRCEVRAERSLVQARIVCDGVEVFSITHDDADAIGAWARDKRQELEAGGWKSSEVKPARDIPLPEP